MMHLIRTAGTSCMALALGCMLTAAPAAAQEYPARTITIAVGFAPGGGLDLAARRVAEGLEEALGVTVLVNNMPGAGGSIANQSVARSAPDGYTLLFGQPEGGVLPDGAPSPVEELEPVTDVSATPFLVAVPLDSPVNSLQDLIDLAKRSSTPLRYAASQAGSGHHLAGELLKRVGGFDMTHVPYQAMAQSVIDLGAGRIPMAIVSYTHARPQLGKTLKLIAIISTERFPALPDVPTVAETLPGFELGATMAGLFVRKGTPPEIVNKINAVVVAYVKRPEVQDWMVSEGTIPAGSSVEDYKKSFAADLALRDRLRKELGFR